ncbi:MAG TPA: PQQ-binding-like beta-propeller repeat protein [Burkholderiales bacterium]|jgi:glucose dehydrogenase|nr:PQQ-binding-like beta-propeller repeat protein [Burkholderiales bacterium]
MHRHVLALASLVFAWSLNASGHAGIIDDTRLLKAQTDPGNWLSHGRDYSNQRFSPLNQINKRNVRSLVPAWTFKSGVSSTFQATPIVADGVMFLSLPFNHVVALDAKTGKELWRYQHKRRTEKMCCGPANRGVAVAYGKVFIGTVDARLIALDQLSGKPVWDIPLVEGPDGPTERTDQLGADDPLRNSKVSGSTGVGANMAPLVYKGKVIIGITGVGYGLHLDSERAGAPLGAVVGIAGQSQRAGFYAAFDANTGKKIWQFDSTPSTGWEGKFRETTADGAKLERDIDQERAMLAQFPDAASRGGGSAWTTPAIDPKENLIYLGVGNPSPQMDDLTRPGDNLYTVSLVALDADSGAIKWYYQEVPHDMWGYDVASPPVLFEVIKGYDTIPAIGQAGKTGWFYVMDRRDGRLLFKSEAFVPQQNMFKRPTAEGIEIAPGGAGGSSWSPVSLDTRNGLAFVAGIHWPMIYTVKEIPATADKPALRYTSLEPGSGPRWGVLSAIDTRRSGKIRWQVKTAEPLVGGVLATAGDLLFVGEGNGNFNAFNSETGELLWQTTASAGVNAPPVTYQVGGKQYIAVAAGGNSLFGFKQGDAVMVFALPD